MEVEKLCSYGFVIFDYKYMYNDVGLITAETAKECLFISALDMGYKGGVGDKSAHVTENTWQNQNPKWQTTNGVDLIDAISFNRELDNPHPASWIGQLQINRFRGREKCSILVETVE